MNIRKGLTLPEDLYDRYASLANERLLLATRTHPYTLFVPALVIGIGWVALTILFLGLAGQGYLSLLHALPLIALVWMFAAGAGAVVFLLWRSHYYIVTNRKIVEIRGFPLFFHTVNDILLDQVRCTEVDIKREGIMHTLLNMGDIILTFDRPTHQEAFAIINIHDPSRVGLFLGDMLEGLKDTNASIIWSKTPTGNNYRFTEEIFPANLALPN